MSVVFHFVNTFFVCFIYSTHATDRRIPVLPSLQAVASQTLEMKEAEQSFTFEGVASEPIPSLLRDMSAPVKLRYEYSDDDLAFLMKHDTDSFNRWEAGQQVCKRG